MHRVVESVESGAFNLFFRVAPTLKGLTSGESWDLSSTSLTDFEVIIIARLLQSNQSLQTL